MFYFSDFISQEQKDGYVVQNPEAVTNSKVNDNDRGEYNN